MQPDPDSPAAAEAAAPPPPPDSFWQAVRQALRGGEYDYTSGSQRRAVLLLAVPMVLEMVMESLFALTDIFWVSRLGEASVAAVGITESIMTLVYAVAVGISIAATAFVSRRIGEKDPERAAHTAGQILILGVLVSAALGIVLGYFAPAILREMGAAEDVIQAGSGFATIMLGGNITVFMIFLLNAVFRGAGDAVLAMRTLWLANGLNILLGPLFIFGIGPFPEMGTTGAAVATNLGRGVGVLYQLWHLFGKGGRLPMRLSHLRPDPAILSAILAKSGSGTAQLLISTTSWVGLFKILTAFGSSAVAGYTLAMRLIMFALLPAWGLANAGATLVGQNLGAQKPDRAEAAVLLATRFNTIFLGLVGLVFVFGAYPIIRLFGPEPEVLSHGAKALWIVSLAFPLYAAGMCLEGAFNGSGDTWTPTKLNFFCFWLGQVPLAWVLAHPLGLGPVGVFIAVPASFSVLALWSFVLFRRGKWKLQKV